MAFAYFPHTEDDIKQMLDKIGVRSLRDLYSDVPEDVIYDKEYDLPSALSEEEVRRYFSNVASMNMQKICLCGLGAYDHYSPSVIPYITSRSEFLTAYTPYQPEVSQGTLRYIFEYQSMITELTGMDCTNASMYDGATAAAEAMMMAMAAMATKDHVPQGQDTKQTQHFSFLRLYNNSFFGFFTIYNNSRYIFYIIFSPNN